CHPQAVGKPEPPQLAAIHDSVTTTFSHAKHAARGGIGKDCLQCHAEIPTTDDTQLPRPTTQSCAAASCHDGKAAFATTTSCTRCRQLRAVSAQLRPPRGHAACTGDGCHQAGAGAGAAPQLTACDGCHQAGLATARETARLRAPWSVRATFDHATHAGPACT